MDPTVVDVEEVPMRHHPMRGPARSVAATALAAALLLAACSSSPSDGGAKDAGGTKDPIHAENEAYLLKSGWEDDQARCVSDAVTIDLEALLTATDGQTDPTKKAGFDEFADAVRSCLRQASARSTTTTVPPG